MSDAGTLQQTCFVIMPFSVREADLARYGDDTTHWSEVYEGLIVPAVKEAGLQHQRDDDDYTTRLVTEGIWRKIERADVVLCDLSSHNPNVHLELGWAMRANKKIVLIKDDVTSFNFDLNQLSTRVYGSTLQPVALRRSIGEIAQVIKSTLAAEVTSSSMIARLQLRESATEFAIGSVEISLLQQVLAEIQSIKSQSPATPALGIDSEVGLGVTSSSEVANALIGSTWRKTGGLEDILFAAHGSFLYRSVGFTDWLQNEYTLSADCRTVNLTWRHDGFVAHCRFDGQYRHFTEQDGVVWWLVARQPYRHPSFGPT